MFSLYGAKPNKQTKNMHTVLLDVCHSFQLGKKNSGENLMWVHTLYCFCKNKLIFLSTEVEILRALKLNSWTQSLTCLRKANSHEREVPCSSKRQRGNTTTCPTQKTTENFPPDTAHLSAWMEPESTRLSDWTMASLLASYCFFS